MKIIGDNPFSNHYYQKLLNKIIKIDKNIKNIVANFIYYLDLKHNFTKNELICLKYFLNKNGPADIPKNCHTFLVIPRIGTISPWSSKATNILLNCQFNNVKRIERGVIYNINSDNINIDNKILSLLHDKMTEIITNNIDINLFEDKSQNKSISIDFIQHGNIAIIKANEELGLALSNNEIEYLSVYFNSVNRNPTDTELMMFAQVNSEHCRHKIFNAKWQIDNKKKNKTLFEMIKNTNKNSTGIISAYKDNSAIIDGTNYKKFFVDPYTKKYDYMLTESDIIMKVETHNHPTAISPFAGAATGVGGEIRDESATGRGSYSKAGLTGFSVSNLKIPGFIQSWEHDFGKPEKIASALEIMINGPLGGAAFNNEFGRPNLAGYFRTLEIKYDNKLYGYHKPIMVAGGVGNISSTNTKKQKLNKSTAIVILGGPGMLIGLGGGSASSMYSGKCNDELDYASVQRGNPEMQRRCQEVINYCSALEDKNPILSIHDVGAGGLSNAVPEIIHDSDCGGDFLIDKILLDDKTMSPMQIWCNESQERYVLAIDIEFLDIFKNICDREQCPYSVIGHPNETKQLTLSNNNINIPMSLLFDNSPTIIKNVSSNKLPKFETYKSNINDLSNIIDDIYKVLKFPAVADKSFLINIGDRSVTGLVVRDQMIGKWQIPVSDVAITASGFGTKTGEAMAMGEKQSIAIINPEASGRMAIGEAITNIIAAKIEHIKNIKISANWMAACGVNGQDAALFKTVKTVGMKLCPELGITIPVGKDSLSMKTHWKEGNNEKIVFSPISLIATAMAPVEDIKKILTPELSIEENTILILIDLGNDKNRLGGSAYHQVNNISGYETPDLNNPQQLKSFFKTIQLLNNQNMILAYHDRSDGGLLTTICEMAFCSGCGVDINVADDIISFLFNEELGAVIQIKNDNLLYVKQYFSEYGLLNNIKILGSINKTNQINIKHNDNVISMNRGELQSYWSETSYEIMKLRDNPECAREWFDNIKNENDIGINCKLTFEIHGPMINVGKKPKLAVLREQGINGHIEMAAAFHEAGFETHDVHMRDLINSKVKLNEFIGIAACGGFSYGDVLGAGTGWVNSILFNSNIKDQFEKFFNRNDTFGLGVCNGCQMLSQLKNIIPGANHWPSFIKNKSEQFESRLVSVVIPENNSIFFNGMIGSIIPIVVAHGEGQICSNELPYIIDNNLVTMQYVNNNGKITEKFPYNPNGSKMGITSLTNEDGRFTIMMPHPERCFLAIQNSWHPKEWKKYGPWFKLFDNARKWVD